MKPSLVLASVSWGSTFVLAWCFLFSFVPVSAMSSTFFVLFIIVAVFASALTRDTKKVANFGPTSAGYSVAGNIEVISNGTVYTQENGGLNIKFGPGGKIFVFIHPNEVVEREKHVIKVDKKLLKGKPK